MEVQISRFELYPSDEPHSYVVGFTIKTNNNRTFYRDILLPIVEMGEISDEQVVETGWNFLKDGILNEVERLQNKSPLIGSVWNPPEQN